MFNGFPSTQTPTVQWWDYSKSNAGTINIALPNDCAPVQYFATGGSTTTIQVTLPPNPTQGKTIIIKNDKYGSSTQLVQINDGSVPYISPASLGAASEVTYCYIVQNTLAGSAGASFSSNWIRIAGGSTYLNQAATCIGGYANSASGYSSAVFGGYNNVASGTNSTVVGGALNTASGTYSHASGVISTANSTNSFVHGDSSTSRSVIGNTVFAANSGTYTGGTKQLGMLAIGAQTTDATATVLRSNTSAASATNQVALAANSAYYFRGECVAGVTAAGNTKGWYIEGVIKRATTAASTVLVGTPSVTSLYADAGAATWNLAVTADTTNGALAITATGQAATTIRWLCQIRTTEMGF
jgi:hypothetical protein